MHITLSHHPYVAFVILVLMKHKVLEGIQLCDSTSYHMELIHAELLSPRFLHVHPELHPLWLSPPSAAHISPFLTPNSSLTFSRATAQPL